MIDQIRRIAGADGARENPDARYREIVERTLLGIIRTGFDGRVLMANPAAARILGYDSEQELAANVPDVRDIYFDPSDRDEAIRILRETGALRDFTVRVRRSDGTPVWVLASAGPIIGDDGEPVGF